MKHLIRMILLVMWLAGCASSEKKSMSTSAVAPTSSISNSIYSRGLEVANQATSSFIVSKLCRDLSSQKLEKKSWKSLVQTANSCVQIKSWIDTEKIGHIFAEKDPASPWGAYYMSLGSEGRGEMLRAMWMIDLSLKKSPQLGLLHYQKSRLLWKMGHFEMSVAEALYALKNDSRLVDAHLFLAQVYFRDQEFESAIKYFSSTLALRPSDKIALTGLAECQFQLGQYEKVLETLNKAIATYPRQSDFRLRKAYISEEVINNPVQALMVYRELRDLLQKQKLEGSITFDIDKKIKKLEEQVQMSRAIAEAPKKGDGK